MNRKLLFAGLVLLLLTMTMPDLRAEQPKVQKPNGAMHMLFTTTGEEYRGVLESIEGDAVKFKLTDGTVKTFKKTEVERIKIFKQRKFADIESLEQLEDMELNDLLKNAPAAEQLPDFSYMTVLRETVYDIQADGSWTVTSRVVQKVLTDEGKNIATQALQYLGHEQSCEIIYGRAISSAGKIFNLTDEAILDEPLHGETAEYDNLRHTKFALKNVENNGLVDYQFRISTKKDALLPVFVDQIIIGQEPVMRHRIVIKTPKGVNLKTVCDLARFGKFAPKMETKKRPDGGSDFTFLAENLPPFRVNEYNLPPDEDFRPRFQAALETTWKDIAAAYLAKAPEMKPSEGKPAEASEISKIYYDVNRNIRKIDVGMSAYGYLPQKHAWEKGYANVLDVTAQFVERCRAAKIPAELVFVRNRAAGIAEETLPALTQFDTCLALVQTAKGPVFLSFHDRYLRFGQVPVSLQGTKGLSLASAGLINIPASKPEEQFRSLNSEIKLKNDGTVFVKTTVVINGPTESGMRQLADKTEAEVVKEIEGMVGGIHPKARLIKWELSKLLDFNIPVTLTYEYEVKNYARQGGGKILMLKLLEQHQNAFLVARAKRQLPYYLGYTSKEIQKISIDIPSGYKVRLIAPEVKSENKFAKLTASFKQTDKRLEFVEEFTTIEPVVSTQDYPAYKKMIEDRVDIIKEWIVLEKGK